MNAIKQGALATLLLSAYIVSGCTTPYKNLVVKPDDKKIVGITELLQANGNSPVDVLIIHGMCTHDSEWANKSISLLGKNLGVKVPDISPRPVPGTDIELYQTVLATSNGGVRISALVWSQITTPLKQQLCYDQKSKSASCGSTTSYPYARARFNSAFKDGLMNDCLADVMIYQGKSKEAIQQQMVTGILAAIETPGGLSKSEAATIEEHEVPLVLVTESLGSKVTIDALNRLKNSTNPQELVKIKERAALVFMAANQLPILGLADQTLSGDTSNKQTDRSDPLAVFFDIPIRLQLKNAGTESFIRQVVALSDPNDILSYPLIGSAQAKSYPIHDAIVSNAPTWFWLAERPDTAHGGYLENPEVMKLIACGSSGTPCSLHKY